MNNEVKAHLLRAVSSLKFSPPLTKSTRVSAETEGGKTGRLGTGETECIELQKVQNIHVRLLRGDRPREQKK